MIKSTNLKTKIISWKVNSALNNFDVIAVLKELLSTFILVPINKAPSNVPIICKKTITLVVAKELGFNSGNSIDKISLMTK